MYNYLQSQFSTIFSETRYRVSENIVENCDCESMCIVHLFLQSLRCREKTCLYLYIPSSVKTVPSICRDGFDLVRWILAGCPVVIQAIDMRDNVTSRLVVIYWGPPTWSRMIAGFTNFIFVLRGINWTTYQHVICSTEYVNPCLDKTWFYFNCGLA